ncbi:hypothetical protein BJ741DRAFT_611610, partial [Chytriomyces cf. hyalinus JEL632]
NQVRRFAHTAPMTQLSRFSQCLSVDGANFDTLQISTSGNGSTKTEILRGYGTHANFSVKAGKDTTASTHAPKVTFDQDQHRTVRLHIHYPDEIADVSSFNLLTTMFSSLAKDSPPAEVVQDATVSITLPHELENLAVEGNVGSCKWDAGNVKNSIKVALTMGNIEVVSPLTCANASLKVNTGTIHVTELTASNNVELKATAGEVKGSFRGYKSMDAETVVGSLNLILHPSSPVSDTSLRCESGSIVAKVFGFQGKFHVETDWGRLNVTGHTGSSPFKSLGVGNFSGWVAKKNVSGGTFGSHAGLGVTNVEFHP